MVERTEPDAATASPPASRPVDLVLITCAHEENLSVHYVAAAAERAGHRSAVLGVRDPAELGTLIAPVMGLWPRVVGLSLSVQIIAPALIAFATQLVDRGFAGHLCCGGHFATLAWQELLRDVAAIDSIVRHEGEGTIGALLEALASRSSQPAHRALASVAGVAFRDEQGRPVATAARPLPPLDELEWPTRVQPPSTVLGVAVAPMVGSRGCYGSCHYCSIHSWHASADGPRYRQRSLDDLVDEMAWLRAHLGVQLYDFHDDNFFVPSRDKNAARFAGLADHLKARGIDDVAIMLKCRPDDLDDASIEQLEQVGLARVLIGVDTANPDGLQTLGRGLSIADNQHGVDLLRQHDIHAAFNLLIFDPDSTLESVAANLDFLEANLDVTHTIGAVRVFAHTPLEARLRAEGRLGGTYLTPSYDMVDPRAELMGRIVDVAMHHRSFRSEGLHQQVQALALELEMLRRFYTPAPSSALRDRVRDVIVRIGQSSVRHLRAIHDVAASVALDDKEAIRRYTRERSQVVHRDDFELTKALLEARAQVHEQAQRPGARKPAPSRPSGDFSRAPMLLPR